MLFKEYQCSKCGSIQVYGSACLCNSPKLTYGEFNKEYKSLFKMLMKYRPDQVGSIICAEKMGDLSDAYPEFTERLENEK